MTPQHNTATREAVRERLPVTFRNQRYILGPRDLNQVNFGTNELIPVIVQDADTDEVLMLAYANRTALALTLDTGEMYFWSRSRKELWRKGATSGNVLMLVTLAADCDSDTVLARVNPTGPACHTGARTCFTTREKKPAAEPRQEGMSSKDRDGVRGGEAVDKLWITLMACADGAGHESYTARLLADRNLRLKKLGEELVELTIALAEGETRSVTREAADLIYHVLVALLGAGVSLHSVGAELARRARERPVAPER